MRALLTEMHVSCRRPLPARRPVEPHRLPCVSRSTCVPSGARPARSPASPFPGDSGLTATPSPTCHAGWASRGCRTPPVPRPRMVWAENLPHSLPCTGLAACLSPRPGNSSAPSTVLFLTPGAERDSWTMLNSCFFEH